MLLDNARAKGVEVREETMVRQMIQENGAVTGVRAVGKNGEALALGLGASFAAVACIASFSRLLNALTASSRFSAKLCVVWASK